MTADPKPLAKRNPKLPDYEPEQYGTTLCIHIYKKYKIGGAVVRLCQICGMPEPAD